MAATLQKLKDLGWHLSEDGLKKLAGGEDGQPMVTDVRELAKRALDIDLREISKGGGLASEYMKSSKLEVSGAGVIVQVMGVRNVSAPKANEESKTSPRMLQLDLTDGQNVCLALEMENIQCLSINTAPGTKILLKGNIKLSHSMLMLGPSNVSIVGGVVAALFEKWEYGRIMAKYAKGIRPNAGPNGPPPWIPFGQKSVQQQAMSKDRSKFKSLGKEEPTESKENAEFTAMRTEAIAQANKGRTKKVFGGGKRNLVDHNVKKIIDKGFTEGEAQMALKYAKNNLERAMGQLKRDRAVAAGLPVNAMPEPSGGGRGGKGNFRERRGREEEPEGAKPSGKVSLFDFLTDKIPMVESIPINSYNSTPSSYAAKPFAAQNSHAAHSNSGNGKRSEDYFNNNSSSNINKRNDSDYSSNRRETNNRRSHDDGPRGYPNKLEETTSRKPSSAAVGKQQDESRASRSENGSANQSARQSSKPISNGSTTNTRGSSNSSGSTQPSTVSSNNPFSLENRAKFQNNMSSSFANRSKRGDDPSAESGNRPAVAKRDSKPAPSRQSNAGIDSEKSKESQKSNEVSRNQNSNTRKPAVETVRPAKNPPKATKIDPVPVPESETKRYENPFSKPLNQRAKSDAKPRATASPALSQDGKVAQLVKHTAALKVSEPPRPKPSKSTPLASASNHNHVASSRSKTQTLKTLDPVFPNGFEFNPNKIMGFTNKETNEVAQSMLKAVGSSSSNDMLSQLLDAASAASNKLAAQSSLSPLPEAFVPAAAHAAPVHQHSPMRSPGQNQQYSVRPMSGPQQQHYQPPMQQQQHQPQFMAPPQAQQPQLNWTLKKNDVCFAKYWEDGRYYYAEITGVSQKTCVVEFMEYGNFEEVLISDCVPITDDNIQMVNQYNAGLSLQPSHYPHHPQIMQPPQQQQQQQQLPPSQLIQMHPQYQQQPPMHQQPLLQTPQQPPHPHQQQQQSSAYQQQQQLEYNQYNQQHLQRMRGERPMYVPPAQRSAK